MRRIGWLSAAVVFALILGQAPALGSASAPARPASAAQPALAARAPARTAAAASALASPPPSSAFGYGYDDEGRLIEAANPSSNTATYQWDKAGNPLGIAQRSSTAVSITQLAPASAQPGASVRIYGTDFSATASQDTVNFNGTAATITAAYTYELVVTVPAGATSGTVSVTAP